MQEDLRKETLHKQFQLVKKRTNTSHVMQYGNRVCIWEGFLLKCIFFKYIFLRTLYFHALYQTNPNKKQL